MSVATELTPAARRFILHWGEMGNRWGVNRTVAQIHALLYLSPRPLNAEEITEALSVARSNVSTSLRELQSWGIVRVVHEMGDRKDHFETLHDVWELFRIIVAERKKREVDPTIEVLRQCVDDSAETSQTFETERLQEMLEFFETGTSWYAQIARLPHAAIVKMFRLGSRLPGLLGVKGESKRGDR